MGFLPVVAICVEVRDTSCIKAKVMLVKEKGKQVMPTMLVDRLVQRRRKLFGLGVVAILAAAVLINVFQEYRRQALTVRPKVEPHLLLLLTANMKGQFEVCGTCPSKTAENIASRASAIKQLRQKYDRRMSFALVEAGNFSSDAESLPYVLECLKTIGYDVVNAAPQDLRYESLLRKYSQRLELPLLPLSNDRQGAHNTSLRVQRRGIQLAFFNTGAEPPEQQVSNVWNRIISQLKSARKTAQVVILTSYWDTNRLKRLLETSKAESLIDLLITPLPTLPIVEGGSSDADYGSPLMRTGSFYRLPPPPRRRSLLMVFLWLRKERVSFATARPVSTSPLIQQDPAVKNIVDRYYSVREERLRKLQGFFVEAAIKHRYVASEQCKSCHLPQYEQWLTTKHSEALFTLEQQRQLKSKCLVCHSEEYRRTRRISSTRKGRGVECLTCHPILNSPETAKKHGLRPSKRRTSALVDRKLCFSCHDKANSPRFQLQTYLEKVTH